MANLAKPPPSYLPHQPTKKQREFLASTTLEALYGGAAGGGKTDAMLMAAAAYVHVPGYSALLLRRTYPDLMLPNAILDRAKQWWIPQGVPWSEKDKRFTFPSGATITFGYMDTENDKFRYQGAELQFIGLDELTQFPEGRYRYLLSRLRRLTGVQVPLRARGASNPGGIGHDWVRRRFIDPGEEGCAFTPATLEDNPFIDRVSYLQSLQRLDPTTRKQLAEGIWIRDGGGLVYGHFSEANGLGRPPGPLAYVMIGLDFGIVDDNAVTVVGWRNNDPTIYVLESYRIKATVAEMADEVCRLQATYRPVRIVGDVGGMGKAFATDITSRFAIPIVAAEKQNKLGFISQLNSDLARGRIKIDEARCGDLLSEWRELPWSENRLHECEGFDNHASDSLLYVWRATLAYHEAPLDVSPRAEQRRQFDAHWADIEDPLEREAVEAAQRDEWGDA